MSITLTDVASRLAREREAMGTVLAGVQQAVGAMRDRIVVLEGNAAETREAMQKALAALRASVDRLGARASATRDALHGALQQAEERLAQVAASAQAGRAQVEEEAARARADVGELRQRVDRLPAALVADVQLQQSATAEGVAALQAAAQALSERMSTTDAALAALTSQADASRGGSASLAEEVDAQVRETRTRLDDGYTRLREDLMRSASACGGHLDEHLEGFGKALEAHAVGLHQTVTERVRGPLEQAATELADGTLQRAAERVNASHRESSEEHRGLARLPDGVPDAHARITRSMDASSARLQALGAVRGEA